jgi:hypothetical protein
MARASIPDGISVADGKLHIGVNESDFLGTNLCCTQEKLQGILNREGRLFVLCGVEFKRDGHTSGWKFTGRFGGVLRVRLRLGSRGGMLAGVGLKPTYEID